MRAAVAFILPFPLLLSLALAAEPAADALTLTMADAVARARESNPAVRAARVDLEAAEAARRGAGAPVQNPEVSVGVGARLTPAGPQADVEVMLEVPLDLGGTARHRRSREAAGLEAARARLAAVELEAAVAARLAFAEAVAAESRLTLAGEAVALAAGIEDAARRRHELGEVSVLEPNSAGLERSSAEAARATARGGLDVAQQRLREVLGLPGRQPLVLVVEPPAAWPAGLSPDGDALALQAMARRSDLLAAREAEAAAAAGLRAARAEGAPGISIGGGWEREGDEANIVGGGVSFEIPLQRNQVEVARAGGTARRAELDGDVLAQQIERDVRAALAAWLAADERHRATSGEALGLAEAHVTGAAAVDHVPVDSRGQRRVGPVVRRDSVHVGFEKERRPVLATGNANLQVLMQLADRQRRHDSAGAGKDALEQVDQRPLDRAGEFVRTSHRVDGVAANHVAQQCADTFGRHFIHHCKSRFFNAVGTVRYKPGQPRPAQRTRFDRATPA